MTQHLPLCPAYLVTNDAFCDNAMQSLLLDGRPPQPIRLRSRLGPIAAGSWQDAGEICKQHGFRAGWAQVKQLSLAARHTGFIKDLHNRHVDILFLWRGLLGRAGLASLASRAAKVPCVYFERGPLPGWLQIDLNGVNARSSIPRDPAFFARWRQQAGNIRDWRNLSTSLVARTPRRDLVAQHARTDWTDEGPFLFCPFQLNAPRDMLPDGGWVSDPAELVRVLARASGNLPDGWHLRIKPHPNAPGDLARLLAPHLGPKLKMDRDTNSLDQLAASQGVVTVNSAMGLEAFFYDKPVIVLGDSYYSDFGRSQIANSDQQLAELLSRPDRLSFDQQARDDLMSFLFNDFFVPEPELKDGRFTVATLLARHDRHLALLDQNQPLA
ncbi:hypothetical protein PAF17_14945 [Paracoccus sp. Z330]|uniref:Capsular biosynthesis protein n=1 Tax=Paracoccus onchidii TaxID=3017813 RepID=A0ABT4ZHF4_9RHOB|nr:hypothetical protein [Paracoccus onchidii]MDB6178792.1 hypothetical protein [Paracoccus onchidii]